LLENVDFTKLVKTHYQNYDNKRIGRNMKYAVSSLVGAFLVIGVGHAFSGDFGVLPRFVGTGEVSANFTGPKEGIRFFTTLDFPPFSYVDADGRLNGFSIYLSKLICMEMAVAGNCTIQALPWDELNAATKGTPGNAIVSGIAATRESREQLAFSRPFLRMPARFVALKAPAAVAQIAAAKIGVVASSAFELMARSFFTKATITAYASEELLLEELRSGKVDVAFGDAMRLSFWLSARQGADCCLFVSDPYYSTEFLGEGMRIAVNSDDKELLGRIDQSLASLERKGKIEELYLRFFPVGFY
jgi:polar amino acid transport system substrate-binding protein